MSTPFYPESSKGRGYMIGATGSDDRSIHFQGDAGFGVMSQARREKLDKQKPVNRKKGLGPR